jgi:hypothetical protein
MDSVSAEDGSRLSSGDYPLAPGVGVLVTYVGPLPSNLPMVAGSSQFVVITSDGRKWTTKKSSYTAEDMFRDACP